MVTLRMLPWILLLSVLPLRAEQGEYNPWHGAVGSLAGGAAGALVGGFAAGPSVERCKDGSNEEMAGFCSIGVLYGLGIGGAVGYSLGVPVGGHFKGGYLNRRFARSLAANILLTGALAWLDYRMYESSDSESLRLTVPLSAIAPHLAGWLVGNW